MMVCEACGHAYVIGPTAMELASSYCDACEVMHLDDIDDAYEVFGSRTYPNGTVVRTAYGLEY